jgi:hypothetical protein
VVVGANKSLQTLEGATVVVGANKS